MNKTDKGTLQKSIYFLKIEELKSIAQKLELSSQGKKIDLINQIFQYFRIKEASLPEINSKLLPKKHKGKVGSDTHIIPNEYTNGKKSRAIFKELIGDHFKFTSYGMDWIKLCWQHDIYPSYKDFATYWIKETARRKAGESFQSAPTNRRVIFFRENKGMNKVALEKAWVKERARNAKVVSDLVNKHLK